MRRIGVLASRLEGESEIVAHLVAFKQWPGAKSASYGSRTFVNSPPKPGEDCRQCPHASRGAISGLLGDQQDLSLARRRKGGYRVESVLAQPRAEDRKVCGQAVHIVARA